MVNLLERISRLIFVAADPGPPNPLDDRYYNMSPGSYSRAGVTVSPETAIKVSAVYRCVSILANVLAMFPKGMHERLSRGRREAPEHPLDPLISFRPNSRQSAFEFWRQVCFHLVLRQNAYVQIVQGPAGRGWVGQLVPLHPDRISGPERLADGKLRYWYKRLDDNQKIPLIGGIDIWHLQGLSEDGLKGLSMMDVASDSIGTSIAAEHHAARYFERGVKATGLLQHPGRLTKETAQEMGESFGRVYGGEAGMGKTPVLWDDMKFVPLTMTMKDAEFLDSRKFSVAEIARWFGVPPHMVGDVERSTSWGTGIEQQGLHFLIYSLLPWIEMLEQSIRFTLVVQPEKFYAKFNVNAILRMDAKSQAEVFAILIDKKVLSPNECRELLERNPYDGGDDFTNQAPQLPQPSSTAPASPKNGKPGASDRALALATARATELLDEECRGLRRLATEHAKSTDGWPAAVAGYYGKFAIRVGVALVCSRETAKNWCEARRGIVMSAGLANLTDQLQHEAALAALTELALSNGGR
jgi:HK97 family phage portal protein